MNDDSPSAPRVLIDATAVPANRGGVGRYVDALVAALNTPFYLACQAGDAEYYSHIAPSATVLAQSPRLRSIPARLLWEQTGLPRLARRLDVDVIHSPHYTMPLLTRRSRVVTFHDATFFSDPVLHTPTKRRFFSAWIRLSSRLANAVMVPSRSTAAELARYVSRKESDFEVAHHGVDTTTFYPPDPAEVRRTAEALGLDGRRWIAFLGTIEPRKNIPALVKAYAALAGSWRGEPDDFPRLALAGAMGWETKLESALDRVRPPAEVMRLGFIPTEQLHAFLGGAVLVVYPSLGEGFGLPVLEAMACGAPVLTTRALALPEVGGDAVEYTDTGSMEASIAALLLDDERRRELAIAGPARASHFSWSANALAHEAVFARVAANRRRRAG
ncbi:MAG: glycosyltransferase family 4 protein [Lacisediminihabitans sp.]